MLSSDIKYAISENEYYIGMIIVLDGKHVLLRKGPVKLRYHLNSDDKPIDPFGSRLLKMESGPDTFYSNMNDDLNDPRGYIIYRSDCTIPSIDIKYQSVVERTTYSDNLSEIIREMRNEALTLQHLPDETMYKVPMLGCNFDLCPDTLEKEYIINGVIITIKAEFLDVSNYGTSRKSYVYRIKAVSNRPTCREWKSKIIEINDENVKLMKKDLMGFVIARKIFDMTSFL